MKKSVLILLLALPYLGISQEKSKDVQGITTTIENYFDGYIERDITKLNKAFDIENGAMKVVAKSEKGTESAENHYFKTLMPKWGAREKLSAGTLENSALTILNIDVVAGKIATAKISMKVGDTIYIDMLSLQKMNQVWKITNKIFTVLENDKK